MNFLTSIPLTPLFSTLGHVSAKAGLSPVLSLLLLLDLVTAAWTCLQFSLLVSAVTWGVIWAACAHAPTGRYSGTAARKHTGHEVGVRGGNVMLAGCLLLVGVCERASGVQSHWVKVCGAPPVCRVLDELISMVLGRHSSCCLLHSCAWTGRRFACQGREESPVSCYSCGGGRTAAGLRE